MSRIAVEPQVTVKDEQGKTVIVDVAPLDWAGVRKLLDEFRKADLPLPDLSNSMQFDMNGGQHFDIAGFITANLPVLTQWLFKHPPILTALVASGAGLTEQQIDSLSASQLIRTARASWKALVDDGFFSEVGGFFGDLLPLGQVSAEQTVPASKHQASESSPEPANGADSPAASKSESEPLPAGA